MSEFQVVAFRAIDAPVSEKNLEFMRRQSSRAEITPWSFDNEYHYGDFHGNAEEMLRRGYDLHLHYADFGIRRLMLRLPAGLPDAKAAKLYLKKHSPDFVKDKKGPGGILSIEPFFEPGDLEELWDLDELATRLVPLRAEILDGDLRPLYLVNMAVLADGDIDSDETKEGPVPAGLEKLSPAQLALAEFYGLSEHLIAAAAQNSPPLSLQGEREKLHAQWLEKEPATKKSKWLAHLMADAGSAVRREILAEFQKAHSAPTWPTVRLDRSIAELTAAADEIQREASRKASEKAAILRAKRLADMAADPQKTIQETERLVKERTTAAYGKIARLLADLREALAGTAQSGLADRQAIKLKTNNPNLRILTGELRRQGFVPK